MTTNHTSEFIFSLAEKYDIPFKHDKPSEILDENYDGFCKEYIEVVKKRDKNLKNYLLKKPTIFKTFLPWSPYVFNTIFQIQWYYDELIIYDPIVFEILNFKTENKEEDKHKLRELITFLNIFNDNISSGFLLFGSYDSFAKDSPDIKTNNLENLIELPDIREELDKLVHISKMEKYNGQDVVDFTIRTYYRGKHSFCPIIKEPDNQTPNSNGLYTWSIDLTGERYVPTTVDEIKSMNAYDKVFDKIQNEYPNEIRETLNYLTVGKSINTPVLFNRKLDELIVRNLPSFDEKNAKVEANNYYRLTLPFVSGIPAQRLFDIRNNIPNAFIDFRNTMFEIIYDLQERNYEPQLLELKIQQKVNPIVQKLEVEMKNSLSKSRILGLGLPIATGLGALGFNQMGVDVTGIAGFLFGGLNLSAELKILTDHFTKKNELKTNPFYYLWNVQQ
ncbi:hypothetical protein [uncultured Draconibacterium sp.]|uniref:hypothetical protein n=1 Tax=uncultured Draconibacterium sp. TaxID=1573823 RepID=UPI0029C76E2D|nr:hypothetical protein [uncultured Draconibacterium sp.]